MCYNVRTKSVWKGDGAVGRGRYSGYRGRPGVRDALKIVAVLLALVALLGAAGLMLAQRYIVYTDDGVRLELPFFQREQGGAADVSVPLDIIQRPGLAQKDKAETNMD